MTMHWRGILGEVAEKCGADVAEALMDEFAGAVIYVPQEFRECGALGHLGSDIGQRLVSEYGGQRIYVPSRLSSRPSVEELFQKIEALVDKGYSSIQIANELGITQVYVFQIRRTVGAPKIANKPDPRQLPLFDIN